MNIRAEAAFVITDIWQKNLSLPQALADRSRVPVSQKALLKELCFGTCRWYWSLKAIAGKLLSKPLKDKDSDVYHLILIGLYQLIHMGIAEHAAVKETVDAIADFKKTWARGLVNAVLRNFQRKREQIFESLSESPEQTSAHPAWLFERIQQAWPEQEASIINSNNQRPPMTLRVNLNKLSREAYIEKLQQHDLTVEPVETKQQSSYPASAIQLAKAVSVEYLPGFEQGEVSVQDAAGQFSATLLDVKPGMRVLDACAAPGGKTAHLLEMYPDLQSLTAVDISEKRIEKIQQNLSRLDHQANLLAADATQTEAWWDGQSFDRILLDAPCTATGIVRRQPDIKLLRTPDQVEHAVELQFQLLEALWSTLKAGGLLLYATCSILPEENSEQITKFMASHTDAELMPLSISCGLPQSAGQQILPGTQNMDGFYYALLQKI